MLQVSDVGIEYSGSTVFLHASFRVNSGEKVALVGANGSGKSSLMRVIAGEIKPSTGTVTLDDSQRVAYLPQDSFVVSDLSLHDEMLSAFADVFEIENRQRAVESLMSRAQGEELETALEEYARLQAEFDRLEGYTIEREVGAVLHGLGFVPNDMGKKVNNFSGGWQSRIAIGKALLRHPDALLLDEPTNHLDLDTTEWLEDYLLRYQGALILVSHDRYFLEKVTTRTLEMERGQVTDYPGKYSWYVAEKQRRRESQAEAYARQQRELERQETFIERFRYKATKASAVKSREKMLARMERVEAPERDLKSVRFKFAFAGNSGRETIIVRNAEKSYGRHTAVHDLTLTVERGDKIAVIGPNGSGKSTLVKLLAGVEKPDRGSVQLGYNAKVSYFAQHQAELLQSGHTVYEEVLSSSPEDWTITDVRNLLGRFLFSGEDVDKPIELLSGGERSRVALLKMLLRRSNVLLLDEPTNHLDVSTRDVLEQAIREYPGTCVVVSHDRYFLDRIATKVLEAESGHFTLHLGNYSELRLRRESDSREEPVGESTPPAPRSQPSSRRAEQSTARDCGRLRQEVQELEREIEMSESRLQEVQKLLSSPDLYTDQDQYASVLREYGELEGRVRELNTVWEVKASRLDALTSDHISSEPKASAAKDSSRSSTVEKERLTARLRELDLLLRESDVNRDPERSQSLSQEYADVYERLLQVSGGVVSTPAPPPDSEAEMRERLSELERALMDPDVFTDESRSVPMIEEYGDLQEKLQSLHSKGK